MIADYRSHPAFTENIRPVTRKGYQEILNYLKPIGDRPLTEFQPCARRGDPRQGTEEGVAARYRVKALLSRCSHGASIVARWRTIQLPRSRTSVGQRVHRELTDRGATKSARLLSEAPAHMKPALAVMNVHRPRAGRRAHAARNAYCFGDIVTDKFENYARLLASADRSCKRSRIGAGAQGNHALCQFLRPAVDDRWV